MDFRLPVTAALENELEEFVEGAHTEQVAQDNIGCAAKTQRKNQRKKMAFDKPAEQQGFGQYDQRQEQIGKKLAELTEESVVEEFPGIVGVHVEGQKGIDGQTGADGDKSEGNGGKQNEQGHAFLDNLEPEDKVASTFHVQKVEVDGGDAGPEASGAENLQEQDAAAPFLGEQEQDERTGHATKPEDEGEHEEGGQLDVFAVDALQAFVVVLKPAEHGEKHARQDAGYIGGGKLGELVGPGIDSETGRGEFLSDDQGIEIGVDAVDERSGQELGSEQKELAERGSGEGPAGQPADVVIAEQHIDGGRTEHLNHQSPYAPAGPGGGDAGKSGKNGGAERNLGLDLEVQVDGELHAMDSHQGIEHEVERIDAGDGHQKGLVVERSNGRSTQIEGSIAQEADAEIDIEYGAVVARRAVGTLDEGRREATVDEHLGDGHEDGEHGDDAVVGRQEQTGQNDTEHKLDALHGKAFEKAPEHAAEGAALQIVTHECLRLDRGRPGCFRVRYGHRGATDSARRTCGARVAWNRHRPERRNRESLQWLRGCGPDNGRRWQHGRRRKDGRSRCCRHPARKRRASACSDTQR